jgi:hypothetical protein
MRFAVSVAIALVMLTSCATGTVCPDGSPAYVEKHCDRLFPLTAKDRAAAAQAQFQKPNLLNANVGVVYASKVVQLAEQISNSTIELQSALTSFCLFSNRNACDPAITSRLIDRTSLISLTYANIDQEARRSALALGAAANDPKQQEQIVSQTEATMNALLAKIREITAAMETEAKASS